MKPTIIVTISAVPIRKVLSVIRETISRRVTSSQAGSVSSVAVRTSGARAVAARKISSERRAHPALVDSPRRVPSAIR